ncbi:MAG: hypothetical protein LC798_21230 [Chloroflexi bacterium]|nr:hypothetical protein [Chloroflexota bacterium]
MTTYRLLFERIGRNRDLETTVDAGDADALAEAVWRFARGRLGSRSFEVTVDLEAMKGSIEYGRFGTFTIEAVSA